MEHAPTTPEKPHISRLLMLACLVLAIGTMIVGAARDQSLATPSLSSTI